jgi:hypothetical protein
LFEGFDAATRVCARQAPEEPSARPALVAPEELAGIIGDVAQRAAAGSTRLRGPRGQG